MIASINIKLPPFTVIYNGGGEFLVNKGLVINATTGDIIYPKMGGEELTDAWTEEGSLISLESGQTILLVITHVDKNDLYFYETVELTEAEITIGNKDDFNSDTQVAIEIATVEYDESYNPVINQNINSDVYIAILGQKIFR